VPKSGCLSYAGRSKAAESVGDAVHGQRDPVTALTPSAQATWPSLTVLDQLAATEPSPFLYVVSRSGTAASPTVSILPTK
jgi:hypothetical protein